ncbi:SUMF1/EgtB/PvdO family nonheme iron enzyme [Candidatus Kaiserbacteria bacterium]|nr:SUMF1/EgtB/PvdO family nonheme iron enzyme [Candidatus Kaiserbacteria bacterium]MCB9811908.1 SUMF1/EgtB/PvdO family nonheme iron enzyme [Candidatus Nomurabacteria bacterium]
MQHTVGIVRFVLVTVAVIAITAVGVKATDSLSSSQTALSIFANKLLKEECPSGSVRIDLVDGSLCVDTYENSVGDACPVALPRSIIDTANNIESQECNAVSVPSAVPWTVVSFLQAKELCARRGMRLPSHHEWYEAALGTPDTQKTCNVQGNIGMTGTFPECRSTRGMFDMVGNVWEWVDAEVVNLVYENRQLPTEGYVLTVDRDGVALTTTSTPQAINHNDYFWSKAEGVFVTMRGGFFNSEDDGGLYSVYAKVGTDFAGEATGFRCVKDITPM